MFVKSSHWRCFAKKSVLKSFAIFKGKQLCWSFFLIKLQAFRPPVNIAKFSRTPILKYICERLLLVFVCFMSFIILLQRGYGTGKIWTSIIQNYDMFENQLLFGIDLLTDQISLTFFVFVNFGCDFCCSKSMCLPKAIVSLCNNLHCFLFEATQKVCLRFLKLYFKQTMLTLYSLSWCYFCQILSNLK